MAPHGPFRFDNYVVTDAHVAAAALNPTHDLKSVYKAAGGVQKVSSEPELRRRAHSTKCRRWEVGAQPAEQSACAAGMGRLEQLSLVPQQVEKAVNGAIRKMLSAPEEQAAAMSAWRLFADR